MNKKIVFFGSGKYTIPVIKKLFDHGLDLVITTEKDSNSPFLKFCSKNNIKTLAVRSSKDLATHYQLLTTHYLGVLASYGGLIPDEIIQMFPPGIINIHPSLLPKYKGPSPVQYTILNGETITGVTLIKIDDQVDHGPILSQKPYYLKGNETSEDLLSILFEIGADLVVEQIEKLENGEILIEKPQNQSQESWSKKIEKKDGQIDIYKLPTINYKLQNMIRAYFPWPGVWFRYSTPLVTASGTKQSSLENKIIKLLPEGKIQVEGKNPMSYKDFINGFGDEGKELLEKFHLLK